MVKITTAKNAGFCFGVRRATEAVESLVERGGGTIYTLGKLIHNDVYNATLAAKGVRCAAEEEIEDLCRRSEAGERIVIATRAHGIQKPLEERLMAAAEVSGGCLEVVDCTCPFVKAIHKIAAENSDDGSIFVLLGDEKHPEVRGIISYASGESYVCANSAEMETLLNGILEENRKKKEEKRFIFAAQTTQNLTEWKKCQKIIKNLCTNASIFDTICNVTENRQEEAQQLSEKMDLMLVVGGHDSSNTKKLFEVCSGRCPQTYFVETAADLPKLSRDHFYNIGITAGASTPDSIIQEVKNIMNEQNIQSFEEMLEASIKTLNTGDTVVGIVTSISNNEIHLDLGAKTTGVITHDQITDDTSVKLEELFKIGDEVEAFVIKVSDIDGIATLSKKRIDSNKNWQKIVDAAESGEVLEGRIVEIVKGGVIISIDSVRVFIPASMTGVPRDGDLNTLINTTQKVKIVEIKGDRKRAYGSIRAVLREERRAKEESFWNEIAEGKVYEGEVKSLTSYGAFVDLGGVDGMVHTSELSWRRIKHPSEVVKVGDVIKVFVKSFDPEKKRISLGYKTEDSDPWYIFTHKYAIGDTASVKIVSIMPFGAFAEVVPGADGLIHISQIAKQKIANVADVLSVGQVVDAKVVDIDNDNRKISLSIRALLEETEAAEEAEIVEEAAEGGVLYSTDNPEAYADAE